MVNEYLERYANHIAEANSQGNFNTPEIIANALRLSRVATRKDFADFKEAFKDYDHGLGSWKKWGGGNKMGSGGAAVNAARRARAEARRSAPDANVNNYTNKNLADRLGLTALSNFVDSRVNDTQGKNMPSNPSFVGVGANPSFQSIGTQVGNMLGSFASDGSNNVQSSFVPNQTDIGEINKSFAPDVNVNPYTNKRFTDRIGLTPITNFLNSRFADVQGKFMPSNPSFVGVGANPSYGVPSIGSFNDVSSFSNFTGGLPSLDAGSVVGDPSLSSLSSFSPDSFLGNMAAIGVGYPHTNVREYDGKFLPYMGGGRPGNVRPKGPAAFIPRMAGIFAV